MRAQGKRLWSEDLELIDAQSLPRDPQNCRAGVLADIGPVGSEGADTFDFEVCTPSGLATRFDADGRPFWARGTLLVPVFSWKAVETALDQLVHTTSGEDWAEIAGKLNRFLRWEFEDYRP